VKRREAHARGEPTVRSRPGWPGGDAAAREEETTQAVCVSPEADRRRATLSAVLPPPCRGARAVLKGIEEGLSRGKKPAEMEARAPLAAALLSRAPSQFRAARFPLKTGR
jgi:hypothetical protein